MSGNSVKFDISTEETQRGFQTLSTTIMRAASNAEEMGDASKFALEAMQNNLIVAKDKLLALTQPYRNLTSLQKEWHTAFGEPLRIESTLAQLEQLHTSFHKVRTELELWSNQSHEAFDKLRLTAERKETIKTLQEEALGLHKLEENLKRVTNQRRLDGEATAKKLADSQAERRVDIKIRDNLKSMEEETRRLTRAKEDLTSKAAENLRAAQSEYDTRKAQVELGPQIEKQYQRSLLALEKLNNEQYRSALQNEELARGQEKVLRMEAQQAAQLEVIRKQRELVNTATAKEIEEEKRKLIAAQQGSQAESEHTAVLKKKADEVSRLAAEVKYLKSEEGQRHLNLTNQLKEEKKMILEASEATKKKQKQLRTANQLTAAWRATLQGLSSSIGMYTSATILTASAMFALSRTFKETISLGREFGFEMAMAQAVMGESADNFSRVEQQVRLLGQTTIFTASEVAQAATELGLAGLNAGQSILALKPTLDLATIGNLNMGKAADHATNIMMTFGREASELANVVDVMATAVTNSNTNVDQLANALTYAGPAAKTAGFSFEETTAAVAALANQGIKASRSGTALRRLFVNLLNPTEKGKKVLEDYNIQVTNLDGSARSLTDVMQQLNDSFRDLPGPEKLTAIQNLVGVYATSPISALIEANDQFVLMHDNMLAATGAAAEMKEQLEQAFEFDVREMKSAFQELQLTVFKEHETDLKLLVKRITETFLWLSEETEGGITRLSMYMGNLSTWLKVIAAFYAANHVMKGAHQFKEVYTNVNKSVKAYKTLTAVQKAVQANMVMTTALTDKSVAANLKDAASAVKATHAYRGLALAKSVAAGLISLVPTLLAGGAAIMATRSALSDVFSSQEIYEGMTKHESMVADIRDRYLEVAQAIKKGNLDKEQKSLEKQLEQSTRRGKQLRDELEEITKQLRGMGDDVDLRQLSLSESSLYTHLTRRKRAMEDLLKKHADEHKALTLTVKQERGRIADQKRLNAEISKNTDALMKANLAVSQAAEATTYVTSSQRIREMRQEALDEAIKARDDIQEILEDLQRQQVEMNSTPFDITSSLDAYAEKLGEVNKVGEDSGDTLEEAMQKAADAIAEANGVLEGQRSLIGNLIIDQDLLGRNIERTLGGMAQSFSIFKKAEQDRLKLIAEGQANEEKIRRGGLSDQERYLEDKKLSLELDKQINEERKRGIPDAKKYKELTDKRAAINLREPRRQGGGDRDEARKLQEAVRLWDQLNQQIDRAGHAQAEYEKKVAQLTILSNTALEKGGITAEQYHSGLAVLRKELAETLRTADALSEQIKSVFERYSSDPYKQQTADIRTLNEGLKEGKITAEEYAIAMNKVNDSISKDIKSNAPDIGISLTPNSGVFQEALKAAVDIAQAEAEWNLFMDKVFEGHQQAALAENALHMEKMAALQQQLEEESLLRSEYDEMTKQEKARHLAEMTALQKKAAVASSEIIVQQEEFERQSRLVAMASMAGSLSSLLGMIADAGEDATTAQKIAFAAQKALSVAQIIMHTEVAAMQAQNEGGTYLGMGLATAIRAQGYASAGLVAALSIGELTGGSKAKNSNYSGAYDKGGYIPAGKYGIVGEYGPEIVNGPAHVTSREETARKLNQATNGGGTTNNMPITIQIEYNTEGGSGDHQEQQKSANLLATTIESVVIKTLNREMRPNGMLSRR